MLSSFQLFNTKVEEEEHNRAGGGGIASQHGNP